MAKPCTFPMCRRMSDGNSPYCVSHKIYGRASEADKTTEKPVNKMQKKAVKIKPVSDKMKLALKELAKIRKRKLQQQPLCQLQLHGCTRKATTLHHVRGRIGKQLLKEEDLLPSCATCNVSAEQQDGLAREKGIKKSKYTKS